MLKKISYSFFQKLTSLMFKLIYAIYKCLFCSYLSYRVLQRDLQVRFYITRSIMHRPYLFLLGYLKKQVWSPHTVSNIMKIESALLKRNLFQNHTVSFWKRANSLLTTVLPSLWMDFSSINLGLRFQVFLGYDLVLRPICLSLLACVNTNTFCRSTRLYFTVI